MTENFRERKQFLYEFETSYVEIGNNQFFEGYCLLFAKIPYSSLNDMPLKERQSYLMEMSILGDAMMDVLNSWRINYNILGNSDHILHAHLFPRYEWEEPERRRTVVHRYPDEIWTDPAYALDQEKHQELRQRLTQAIDDRYQSYLKERGLHG